MPIAPLPVGAEQAPCVDKAYGIRFFKGELVLHVRAHGCMTRYKGGEYDDQL